MEFDAKGVFPLTRGSRTKDLNVAVRQSMSGVCSISCSRSRQTFTSLKSQVLCMIGTKSITEVFLKMLVIL